MKLIAESGSTRTEWALVEDNHLVQRVLTLSSRLEEKLAEASGWDYRNHSSKKNWIKYITMVPDAVHMKRKIS